MEYVMILALMGFFNLLCFIVGAKVGQTVNKGNDIRLPQMNPMDAIQERTNRRQAQRERDRLDQILKNIDRYDGTGTGQKEIDEVVV